MEAISINYGGHKVFVTLSRGEHVDVEWLKSKVSCLGARRGLGLRYYERPRGRSSSDFGREVSILGYVDYTRAGEWVFSGRDQ